MKLVDETTPVPEEAPKPVRTAQLIRFRGITRLDLAPDDVLGAAVGELSTVVVLGYDKDGKEYFASSVSDGADVLWLLERCKVNLLQVGGYADD